MDFVDGRLNRGDVFSSLHVLPRFFQKLLLNGVIDLTSSSQDLTVSSSDWSRHVGHKGVCGWV